MKIVILQGGAKRRRRRAPVASATAAAGARPERGVLALGNGEGQWVLINVSPAVAHQLDSDGRLDRHLGLPDAEVRAVVLTEPQIDSVGGLLSLRGGAPIDLYATPAVFEQLTTALPVLPVLQHYCGVHWHVVPVAGDRLVATFRVKGLPSLEFTAVASPPGAARSVPGSDSPKVGDSFALAVRDLGTGQRVFCAAGSHPPSKTEIAWMHEADCLLLDPLHDSPASALAEPGHTPPALAHGWLTLLQSLPARHKVLLGEAAGRNWQAASSEPGNKMTHDGIALAYDGMEIDL